MSNPALSEFADFATKLADQARDITQRYFRQPQDISRKSDGTPVTIADLEIEQKARLMITDRYPDHGVYGEEEGEAAAAYFFSETLKTAGGHPTP